jgi:hypothetical protein
MSRWFRIYDDLVHDRKVQDLPLSVFKGWINILCIASKHGGTLPSVDDIAFALRVPIQKAKDLIRALTAAGLIDQSPDGRLSPHNWKKRQHTSDVSTERVRAFRERHSNGFMKHEETF